MHFQIIHAARKRASEIERTFRRIISSNESIPTEEGNTRA